MEIFLGIIASILFCLVVYVVFFNTGVQDVFISKKKKKRILEIIDEDNKTTEEKVDVLINITQRNGKKNHIKLYRYLNKSRYNKKFSSDRKQRIDSIILHLDSVMCQSSELTHLLVKIEKGLNNRDYDDVKKQVDELKTSLVSQRHNDGFNNLYGKIASIVLAIITVLSFIFAFTG